MSVFCSINHSPTIMEFFIYPKRCTACMSCILACSLHHTKAFNPKIASIEVNTFGKEREIQIIIHRKKEGVRLACDNCRGEEEPLCIKYCIPKALEAVVNEGF